jgi:putative aldouronate transport system permease protein
MNRATAIRESVGDRIFLGLIYIFLFCVLAVVVYPLLFILSSSFSSPQAVTGGRVWLWPVDFSLMGYKVIFSNPAILTGYMNSFIYTVLGVTINIVMTVAIAYPLSK